jgi:hypothetical protein
MSKRGEIVFTYKGILELYDCTCCKGTDEFPEVEPDESGVYCYTCGASASWPKPA